MNFQGTCSAQCLNAHWFLSLTVTDFEALDDAQLVDLARSDELELVYVHLHSMRNFSPMVERAVGRSESQAETSDQ